MVALPPRFLCRNARAADGRDRRDYPARGRVETSPSGRVVHLWVILVLFRDTHAQNFRVLQAICTTNFTAVLRDARGPEVSRASQ